MASNFVLNAIGFGSKGGYSLQQSSGAAAIALAAAFMPAHSASASIVFSEVNVTGSLSAGVSFATSTTDIDFTMTTTRVGDVTDPVRDGNLVITYVGTVAQSGPPVNMMHVSILGALAGSGQIFFNELIEDNVTGARLATFNATITDNNQLPFDADIPFIPSAEFKVKKTFYMVALPSAGFDVAQVGLCEQRITPSPGPLALLGCGGFLAMRRRR